MSYLLDRKKRNAKIRNSFFVFLILFVLFYFRSPILNFLNNTTNSALRPFFVLTNNIGTRMYNFSVLFNSKESLLKENQELKDELNNEKGKNSEYIALTRETEELKEILGRTDENKDTALASILVNNKILDTFIIDIGENQNIKEGDLVFAYGNIPVGYVSEVYNTSSKVNLFSKNKEKTNVLIQSKNIYIDLIGRGGGNFEIILPRDLILEKGENVLLPNIDTYLIAKVDSIISDPRDSFQKALLTTPININQLRFVQVVK